MYLARFEFSGEPWLQACVRLGFSEDTAYDTEWAQLLRHLVTDLSSAPYLRFGYRISLSQTQLKRSIFLLAQAVHEAQLRRSLASFIRLNLLAEDSVQIPQSRQEHDECISSFPRYRCFLSPPAYMLQSNLWVACDFNGRSIIEKLSQEASALGHEFGYHACCEPTKIDAPLRRDARKNMLHLRNLSGMPTSLAQYQENLSMRLDTASFLIDELLGVSSADAAEWLYAALQRNFQENYGGMRFEIPEFSFDEDDHELPLTAVRQRSAIEELSLQEICSLCADEDDLVKLLAWCPSKVSHRSQLFPISEKRVRDSEKTLAETLSVEISQDLGIPEPASGGDNYIFISYKRQDMPRIAPVLKKIAEWGYKIWYDKGIPGGSEWESVIEERLTNCRLLIVFVSQRAIESRFVRREVRFADTVSKAIIPVQLDFVEWVGMGMLLSQLQAVACSTPEEISRLKEAIEYIIEKS
jgi:hypothetical protein